MSFDFLLQPNWWWLFAGLLLGWLIEWVIDWIYWRRQRDAVSAELETSRSATAKLEGALGEAKSELGNLRTQVNTFDVNLQAAKDARAKAEADLKACMDLRAKLEGELGEGKAELGNLRTQVNSFDATLQTARDAAAKAEAELKAAGEAKLKAEADWRGAHELNGKLQAELDGVRADLDGHKTRSVKLEGELGGVQSDLTAKLGLLAGAEALAASLRGDLDGQRARAEAAEAEVLALKAEAGNYASRFDADLGALKLQADGAQVELGEVRAQLGQAQADLQAAQDRNATLTLELENARTQFESELNTSLPTRLSGAEVNFGALNVQAEGAPMDLGDLQAQLAASASARHQADDELNQLKAQLANAQVELSDLRAQVSAKEELGLPQITRLGVAAGALGLQAEGAEAELAQLRADLLAAQGRNDALAAELDGVRGQLSAKVEGESEALQLRADLLAAQGRSDALAAELDGVRGQLAASVKAEDETLKLRTDLTEKAGLLLGAEALVAQLRGDLDGHRSRANAVESELAQLRLDCAGKSEELSRLQMALETMRTNENTGVVQITAKEAELVELRAQLLAAQQHADELEEELAAAALVAKAAPSRSASLELQAAEPDDFEPINGIGPVFERRLYDAGLTTYEQLAETPAERILEIVKAKPWQAIDAGDWIRQAREFAAAKLAGTLTKPEGDDLVIINGIGPVFARRLRSASITTFAQLAETANDRLLEIVKAKSWQAIDPDFWRQQARDLATK